MAGDLKTWQEKFAKAADEGSAYLEDHITEITDRLVKNQAEKVGAALNIQLEEKVQSSLKVLKSTIISIVESSKENEDKEDALKAAVRKAGVGIKEKAQAVRTWRQSFDREVMSLVSKSAEDTFEILDHIRDLGLQEIGMRWAWTDGITHKDWAKYHKLKTKFDEWRLDVEKVVSDHEGVAKAKAASEDVESNAMGTAEDAAKELARLRETGRWKISAGDTSDDWSTKVMPAAAAAVGEKIKEKLGEASEAIIGTPQGTLESVASLASSSIVDAASSISAAAASEVTEAQNTIIDLGEGASSAAAAALSSVIGEPQATLENIVAAASERASSIAAQLSSSVVGTQQGTAESVTSVASASASSIVDQASSIIGTSVGSAETAASSLSTDASSLAARASSSAAEAAEEAASTVSSAISEVSEAASEASSWLSSESSEASSTASKKVWGGAVAQSVEAKSIILDDVVEDRDEMAFSEKVQSLASEAGDRYADVTRAVSEALNRPTSTGDVVQSVTALAAEQYSSALHAASVALYGTEQGAAESVASVVTSRYADAVSA